MNINQIKEDARQKELAQLEHKYKRTVRLCKAIYREIYTIDAIKDYLTQGKDLGASECWNELDYEVQKLLITAPTFGGPFTTEEVKKIKEIWEISADDMK